MEAKPPQRPPFTIGGGEASLPRSRSVLLLVDFINPLQFEGAQDIAAPALQAARRSAILKAVLSSQGIPALYANDNYGTWRSEFSDLLAYCQGLPGAAGEMARLLAPQPDDLTLLKPRHSGFYATPLELLLTQMHAQELIVVGLAADICVQVTAMDAYLRGYRVWVPGDCTAAETPARQQAALDYLARVLKADTRPSTELAQRAWHTDCPAEGHGTRAPGRLSCDRSTGVAP